jgi:hypothetical protein
LNDYFIKKDRIADCGFPFDGVDKQEASDSKENGERKSFIHQLRIPKAVRIQLSPVNFNYLVDGITYPSYNHSYRLRSSYALFKSQTKAVAKVALEAISSRASYDLQPQIMLSTNSLKHIIAKEKEYPSIQ